MSKVTDKRNCRSEKSKIIHILEESCTPSPETPYFDTMCGRRLTTGFYCFPFPLPGDCEEKHKRCEKCDSAFKLQEKERREAAAIRAAKKTNKAEAKRARKRKRNLELKAKGGLQ